MLLDEIRRFLSRHGIPPCRLVAAVSGGTDSTALLMLLAGLRNDGYEVVAAHVNHHLRGAESDEDEAFVRTLCSSLGVDLFVCDGTLAHRSLRSRGIEAAAREVRYERLREVRERTGARCVATAHQKDDQAETILMRLSHASGLEGLRGIQPVRDDGVVRPLLTVRREQIDEYLAARGIAARHDRSNDDLRFERNRARALLRAGTSPAGAPSDGSSGLVDLLAGLASKAQALWPAIERSIDEAEAAHLLEAAGIVRFVGWPEEPWLRQELLRRAIRRLDAGARNVSRADLERLTRGATELRRVSVTKRLELVADDATLILRARNRPVAARFEVRLTPEAPVVLEGGTTMTVRRVPCADPDGLRRRARDERRAGLSATAQVFELPAGAVPEFVVRPRRPGDRFQPLGLDVSKRLKDLLIDRRIAAELRDHLPLLVWNGEIVWVPGVEVSERFKVTSPAGVFYEVRMEVSGAGDDDNHAHVHR